MRLRNTAHLGLVLSSCHVLYFTSMLRSCIMLMRLQESKMMQLRLLLIGLYSAKVKSFLFWCGSRVENWYGFGAPEHYFTLANSTYLFVGSHPEEHAKNLFLVDFCYISRSLPHWCRMVTTAYYGIIWKLLRKIRTLVGIIRLTQNSLKRKVSVKPLTPERLEASE
jgi:RsiW-degrading membrane proteinase PrsW (M82 family)